MTYHGGINIRIPYTENIFILEIDYRQVRAYDTLFHVEGLRKIKIPNNDPHHGWGAKKIFETTMLVRNY